MRIPERKFTLLDAMILVAAMAVAIVWTRTAFEEVYQMSTVGLPAGGRYPLLMHIHSWLPVATPTLASFSVAHCILRLRQPRPLLRRLAREPGFVATACVGMTLALQIVLFPIAIGLKQIPGMNSIGTPVPSSAFWGLALLSMDSGLSVLSGWLLLLWIRGWRPAATWLDRSGRLLGACWVAHWVFQRTAVLTAYA